MTRILWQPEFKMWENDTFLKIIYLRSNRVATKSHSLCKMLLKSIALRLISSFFNQELSKYTFLRQLKKCKHWSEIRNFKMDNAVNCAMVHIGVLYLNGSTPTNLKYIRPCLFQLIFLHKTLARESKRNKTTVSTIQINGGHFVVLRTRPTTVCFPTTHLTDDETSPALRSSAAASAAIGYVAVGWGTATEKPDGTVDDVAPKNRRHGAISREFIFVRRGGKQTSHTGHLSGSPWDTVCVCVSQRASSFDYRSGYFKIRSMELPSPVFRSTRFLRCDSRRRWRRGWVISGRVFWKYTKLQQCLYIGTFVKQAKRIYKQYAVSDSRNYGDEILKCREFTFTYFSLFRHKAKIDLFFIFNKVHVKTTNYRCYMIWYFRLRLKKLSTTT